MTRDLNLPWTTEKVENDWALPNGAFPWLVLDKWHVVIARFDYEEQARLAVKAANREEYEEIASHRDAMVRALATDLDDEAAARVVDTLLARVRRVEGLDE